MPPPESPELADLLIIGGGVNGCGIARDAAGRGLSVDLVEMGDLGGGTSSASSKLFHGGLRYLEYFEFRLVREALREREVLLRAMPHLAKPMRFVIPYHPAMRFEAETPASRLLARFIPWMKGRRPAFLIRLGLFLYDHLGGRKILPAAASLHLEGSPAGAPLQPQFRKGFVYSDVWVDDARLVVLNARDAADRGARIHTRHRLVSARVENGVWHAEVDGPEGRRTFRARALVNAAGPWAGAVLEGLPEPRGAHRLRLVRGSHIVVPQLFAHDDAYFLQGSDGRIIFAIPWQGFTMLGTTDADHASPDLKPRCSLGERDYLLAFANRYFIRQLGPDDVIWSFAGVRPLHDDGTGSATAATRDYTLELQTGAGAPLLTCFGGKITTYRKLAEAAMAKLGPALEPEGRQLAGARGKDWTAGVALPGGDFPPEAFGQQVTELAARHGFLTRPWAERLLRAYGHDAARLLRGAARAADLGRDFGATLTEAELEWMVAKEWAQTAEDALWRRSKLGLHLNATERAAVEAWFDARSSA